MYIIYIYHPILSILSSPDGWQWWQPGARILVQLLELRCSGRASGLLSAATSVRLWCNPCGYYPMIIHVLSNYYPIYSPIYIFPLAWMNWLNPSWNSSEKGTLSCESNLRHPADETTPPEWSLWGTVGTPDRSTRRPFATTSAISGWGHVIRKAGLLHIGLRASGSEASVISYETWSFLGRNLHFNEENPDKSLDLGVPYVEWTLFRIKPSILGGQ